MHKVANPPQSTPNPPPIHYKKAFQSTPNPLCPYGAIVAHVRKFREAAKTVVRILGGSTHGQHAFFENASQRKQGHLIGRRASGNAHECDRRSKESPMVAASLLCQPASQLLTYTPTDFMFSWATAMTIFRHVASKIIVFPCHPYISTPKIKPEQS